MYTHALRVFPIALCITLRSCWNMFILQSIFIRLYGFTVHSPWVIHPFNLLNCLKRVQESGQRDALGWWIWIELHFSPMNHHRFAWLLPEMIILSYLRYFTFQLFIFHFYFCQPYSFPRKPYSCVGHWHKKKGFKADNYVCTFFVSHTEWCLGVVLWCQLQCRTGIMILPLEVK